MLLKRQHRGKLSQSTREKYIVCIDVEQWQGNPFRRSTTVWWYVFLLNTRSLIRNHSFLPFHYKGVTKFPKIFLTFLYFDLKTNFNCLSVKNNWEGFTSSYKISCRENSYRIATVISTPFGQNSFHTGRKCSTVLLVS